MTFSQGNEMTMTSFPTFMNGAYSHEPKQINLLQERAKLLEGQVLKLTVENNALRTAFQCLADAIGLRNVDPCQVDGNSFAQLSTALRSKVEPAPPTPSDYPSIRFWDREDWDKYLESPEGQTSRRGTMGYLEDKDGNPPSSKTAKAIHKVLRGGWVELVNRELAPPSWGRLSASGRQFIHSLMENAFPDFKFANNGWKLDYLASTTYPAWRKAMLDDNGKWKQKKGKDPKTEDDNDDESTDDVGMKRKAFFKSEAGPEKRFKGEHTEESNETPSASTTSLSSPSDASTTSFESSTVAPPTATRGSAADTARDNESMSPFPDSLCRHEKETVRSDADATTSIMSIDPLAALAIAASKARDIPTLPLLDTSQALPPSSASSNNTPSNTKPILDLEDAVLPAATPSATTIPAIVDNALVTSVSKSAKGGGKAKMRPGPAKNGRNLCAHRWRKQVQSNGSTEEFQKYYIALTSAQRQAYDDEAAALDSAPKHRKYYILQGFVGECDDIYLTFTATLKLTFRHIGSQPRIAVFVEVFDSGERPESDGRTEKRIQKASSVVCIVIAIIRCIMQRTTQLTNAFLTPRWLGFLAYGAGLGRGLRTERALGMKGADQ
ncbi:hypothetical protein EDD15DRAFT_2518825 [Pisolithus albus]|nr:hypothetical protein EDD15DRAFT_2518825 [Pisolithus albus]